MEQYKRIEGFQKENGYCNINISDVDGTLPFWIVDQQACQQAGKKIARSSYMIWVSSGSRKKTMKSLGVVVG